MLKNVILDFGGVLLDLDYDAAFHAMAELTGLDISYDALPAWFQDISDRFEKGQISEESFIWTIQDKSLNRKITPRDIVEAWNKMLLGWNPEKLRFLEEANKKYRLYLLSNTNVIHIRWVHYRLLRDFGIQNFEERFFKKVYYSHLIGMRKPEPEIFQLVITDNRLKMEETLYLDDSIEHIRAANDQGIPSVCFERNSDLDIQKLETFYSAIIQKV
ncbi:MAG: HAD family phosphatase [Saprospiraceae bacterium]|nr:HAD family phosphatase [Saprospiraceae bacterium]